MKKPYKLILILVVLLAFTACKRNHGRDNLIDNAPSRDNNADGSLGKDNIDDVDEIRDYYNDREYQAAQNEQTVDIVRESDYTMNYYITGDIVRMREDASLEADILILLRKGTKVEYLDRKGEWIKVSYDNKIGYIRSDLLSETEPLEVTADEVIGDEVIGDEVIGDDIISIEDIDNPRIIVKKADRVLQLWDGETLIASYPVGLGWEPISTKEKEGDGRSPEGTYYICTRNNFSRFYLSLGLSYPNIEDARVGLEVGLIDQNTYNQIEEAINREVQPPWNTALGGEIMIHGHGSQSDWTAGCIAVDNDVMDILWEHGRMGTTVIIEP